MFVDKAYLWRRSFRRDNCFLYARFFQIDFLLCQFSYGKFLKKPQKEPSIDKELEDILMELPIQRCMAIVNNLPVEHDM